MNDLTLDFKNKTIKNTFITSRDLVLQKVKIAVQIWNHDWYIDYNYGIKYKTRFKNKGMLTADIENAILNVDGVNSVQDINIQEDIVDGQKIYYLTGSLLFGDELISLQNGEVIIIGV